MYFYQWKNLIGCRNFNSFRKIEFTQVKNTYTIVLFSFNLIITCTAACHSFFAQMFIASLLSFIRIIIFPQIWLPFYAKYFTLRLNDKREFTHDSKSQIMTSNEIVVFSMKHSASFYLWLCVLLLWAPQGTARMLPKLQNCTKSRGRWHFTNYLLSVMLWSIAK